MGGRGPVPKKDSMKVGKDTRGGAAEVVQIDTPLAAQPEPSEAWNPIATRWYESLAESGQALYYQSSDWQHAWIVAEIISSVFDDHEEGKKYPAMLLQTLFGEMTNLMTTEGSRRRLRLEIEREKQSDTAETAAVTSIMANYGKAFGTN